MYAGDDAMTTALAYAARHSGAAVIGIEEGNQLALNANLINFYGLPYSRLLVASRDEKQRFEQCGHEEDRLRIVGLTTNPETAPLAGRDAWRRSLGIADDDRLLVYACSPLQRQCQHSRDTLAHRQRMLEALRTIHVDKLRVLIKLHPVEDVNDATTHVRTILPDAIVVGGETPIETALAGCDVLLNRGNSQVALQAIQMGRPTVVMPQGLMTIFETDGGALIARDEDELKQYIEMALTGPLPDTASLLAKHVALTQGRAAEQLIAEEITRATSEPMTADESLLFGILFLEKRCGDLAEEAFTSATGLDDARLCARALGHARAGSEKEAMRCWRRAAEQTNRVQLWIEASRAAGQAGRFGDAHSLLASARDGVWTLRHSRPHVIDMVQAGLLRLEGRLNEAIERYAAVLSDMPEYWQVRYQTALTFHIADRTRDARRTLLALLADSPDCQPAHSLLGRLDRPVNRRAVRALF